ncbi:FMN-dependent NADH-azoreductase [Bryocella elongata]|uniref:FMN dependent NADH:quinone oxidoreductase n=1 Tax=Bryocella elongata TaxID=863522 RepID=A0A1H6A7A0_9BACT|nr:NAD(P)H-dependent oxidoreductase [Bryocella elongata]SEG43925.1 FMN-dependent NADH-azoreductase [Bryocella elongata]
MKILHLDSSVTGANSISRPLTAATVARLLELNPGAEVTYRDLVNEPLPHNTAAARTPSALGPDATAEQKLEVALGQTLLDELFAAEVVVIGVPMYNFGISSQLKSWIDYLAVPGKTFSYSAEGPKGLAGGRRVILVSTRGGQYGPGSPYEIADFQEKYVKFVFGFLGITEVEVIRAEGVGRPDVRESAIAAAKQQIAELK